MLPLPSSPKDAVRELEHMPPNFGPVIALSSGPAVSKSINSELPGKNKSCEYNSRLWIYVF